MSRFKRLLVTSALPYANGPLHIGHIAGAYLPADIYTRFQRAKKRDVIHICGTDEHGVAITIAARREGKTPKELVDYYHENIKKSFENLGIYFDNFSRTTRPVHYELSQQFFLKLYNDGYIEKREVQQFYCPNDKMFLPDRYVVGTCPYCGYDKARGDQCEKCGRWLEPTDLINPRCAICGATPELRNSFHYFFLLNKLQDRLKEWLESKSKKWKPNVVKFALGWVKEGLKPRAITRDLEWGVPVPLEEAKGKVLYVWFDAPIGYISSTKEWNPNRWEEFWKREDTRLIHFIGKDNIVFHAVVWPAMLMAHGEYVLPDEIPANEFLNLMGEKLSTSRGWAFWVDELLERFPADYIRFGIAYILPENKDSDFDPYEFKDRVNKELINKYGNLVSRIFGFINRFFDGKIPNRTDLTPGQREAFDQLVKIIEESEEAIENFEFRKALYTLISGAEYINAYIDKIKPWALIKENPEEAERELFLMANMLRSITIGFEPYVPFSTRKVLSAMGIDEVEWDKAKEIDESLAGRKVENIGPLYKKIEDSQIEELVELLKKRAAAGGAKVEEKKEEKQYITYDEFMKVELRVARVKHAERIPKSKKLLRLIVDLGDEERQIVAGIAQYYDPEDLIGKNIVIVANLQPRKLMGYESQGMLLAAGEEPILLTTEKWNAKPGERIK